MLKNNFGTTDGAVWTQGDFNGDGAVDLQDFGILKSNFGAGGLAIAEPASAALLAIGAWALVRRRRES